MEIFPSYKPSDYVRVLKLSTKPTNKELKLVSGVSAAGLAVVGLLGFIIYSVMSLLPV